MELSGSGVLQGGKSVCLLMGTVGTERNGMEEKAPG